MFNVGDRVVWNGRAATVLYLGTIHSTLVDDRGLWYWVPQSELALIA